MKFEINERLSRGGIHLAEINSCHILLKNEATFPWLIVVPEVDSDIEDLHQLSAERLDEVMQIVRYTSRFIDASFELEKLNVGCIGNQVRQMHIHVIGRRVTDPAWPGVVWGSTFDKKRYTDEVVTKIQNSFMSFMKNEPI